jgi:hypothetical protein
VTLNVTLSEVITCHGSSAFDVGLASIVGSAGPVAEFEFEFAFPVLLFERLTGSHAVNDASSSDNTTIVHRERWLALCSCENEFNTIC